MTKKCKPQISKGSLIHEVPSGAWRYKGQREGDAAGVLDERILPSTVKDGLSYCCSHLAKQRTGSIIILFVNTLGLMSY